MYELWFLQSSLNLPRFPGNTEKLLSKLGFAWSLLFLRVPVLIFALELAPVSELLACALVSPWMLWGVAHTGMKGQFYVLLTPSGRELQYWFHNKYIVAMTHCLRTGILICISFLEVIFVFSSRSVWMGYFPDEAWWASFVGRSVSRCSQCSHQHRLHQADWCFPHRVRIT